MGNKVTSRSATTGRSFGRAAQQRTDVVHARETLAELESERHELEQECEADIRDLRDSLNVESLTLEPLRVPCRKGDLKVELICLLWVPWEIDSDGIAAPLVEVGS